MAASVPPASVPSVTGTRHIVKDGASGDSFPSFGRVRLDTASTKIPRRYSDQLTEFANRTNRNDYEEASTQPILPWIGLSEGERAALVYEPPQRQQTSGDQTFWQRLFWKIGSAHELSSEFRASIVVPNLQFKDRLLEYFYSDKYYRQRVKHRIMVMVTLGFMLIAFQLWLGFSNAIRLRTEIKEQNDLNTSQAESIGDLWQPSRGGHRKLWGPSNSDPSTMSFYTLACVDQSIFDLFLLCLWLILAYIPGMAPRMEVISITAQLLRAVLLIFFAQGMYSPCAIHQGPRDIIMNNLAVATANISVFNAIGLARVRRACFISVAWLAGIVEVCIVISQSSQAIEAEDTPQLALFIFIFATFPLLALAGRYRAEVSEREALFYAVELQKAKMNNNDLTSHLAELEAVRNLDIEKALPEGVVPSQIVHVAVMELKMASKTAEALHNSLPNLIADNALVASPEFDRRQSHMTSVKNKMFRSSKEPQGGWIVPESSKSGWTRNAQVNQKLNTTQHIGVVLEASNEVKTRISAALKLLSKSHDLYSTRPKDPYQGAMMFHALGHDGNVTFGRSAQKYPSPSTSGAISRGDTQISPVRSDGASPILQDMPHLQHMPFLTGLGDFARNIGQNWDYNLLKVAKVTKDQALITTAMLLASPIAERLPWIFDWTKFYSFMKVIQNDYGPSDKIPYHNRTHGAIHAHTTTVLLTWFHYNDYATPLECLAVLIASLCHDVGHPGRTNAYLVNASRRLAIIYNDISVLENTHASKTFETMQEKDSNFLSPAQNEDYRCFRKMVIELILSTDMKMHFELINNYSLRRGTPEFKAFSDENKMSTLKLIIKAADLSHGAMDWLVHQQLSMAVNEEFWAQGDAEEKLGLPKSPLCDRAKSHELATQQIGFLEFVVLPLYMQLADVDMSGFVSGTCESAIKANIAKWKVMAASQTMGSLQRRESARSGALIPASRTERDGSADIIGSSSTGNGHGHASGSGGTGFELISPVTTRAISPSEGGSAASEEPSPTGIPPKRCGTPTSKAGVAVPKTNREAGAKSR